MEKNCELVTLTSFEVIALVDRAVMLEVQYLLSPLQDRSEALSLQIAMNASVCAELGRKLLSAAEAVNNVIRT